jgi:hypothetical protein
VAVNGKVEGRTKGTYRSLFHNKCMQEEYLFGTSISTNIVHGNSVTNFKIVLKRLLGFNDLKLYFSSQRLFLFIFIQRGHMN